MKAYRYWDNVFTFEGAITVQAEAEWAMPWRIDFARSEFYPVLADDKARDCSGIRICFTTDTTRLGLNLVEPAAEMLLDLVVDGRVVQQVGVDPEAATVFFAPLPEGMKNVEIWLDQRFPCKVGAVLVDETARISKTMIAQKRWVHYGSSISQSKAGKSPTQIWAAMVARRLGLHLTNLGFSGECKLDPMIGRLIRDREADVITLKLGINLYRGDLTERTFAPNVIGLIQLIRERHPATPLAVVSPIYSRPREETLGGGGLNLQMMRRIIAGIVASCKKYGDTNIYYVDGVTIFGPEAAERYMPDELHPDGGGQFVLAEQFIKKVFRRLPVGCSDGEGKGD